VRLTDTASSSADVLPGVRDDAYGVPQVLTVVIPITVAV